jgi:hypothetical protein
LSFLTVHTVVANAAGILLPFAGLFPVLPLPSSGISRVLTARY